MNGLLTFEDQVVQLFSSIGNFFVNFSFAPLFSFSLYQRERVWYNKCAQQINNRKRYYAI